MVIGLIEPACGEKARAGKQLVAEIIEMVTEEVVVEIGGLVLPHNYHVLSSYANSSYYVCPIPLYKPVFFSIVFIIIITIIVTNNFVLANVFDNKLVGS